MLDGAAPCRRPFIGLWPTAHPYVLNFGKIEPIPANIRKNFRLKIPANLGENLAKLG